MEKIRLGLMGFGEISRHLYRLCLDDDRIEIVAISDIGEPEILHYLLMSELKEDLEIHRDGNYLISKNGRARMFQGSVPKQIPWDAFNVDMVLDSTRKYLYRKDMEAHRNAGARRVMLSTLPKDEIDRVVVWGVNENSIKESDRLISPGSSTTNATALMLKILDEAFGVEYAMMTTIHSYTADQPLRNLAGENFRRSRSAVTNIIPNISPTPERIQRLMPEFEGRIEGSALNVPVHAGSLLDLTTILKKKNVSKDDIDEAVSAYAKKYPDILEVASDPIVSTDITDDSHSAVYDKKATIVTENNMVKTITWYHVTLAMASRIKQLILAYDELDKKGGKL